MKCLKPTHPGILSLKNRLLLLASTFAFAPVAFAADVTLAWDPSPDAGVASYQLHYGTSSGNYTVVTNAGLATTLAVTGLVEGTTYYFGATAVGTNQLESDFSNEIIYTVPLPQNTPPAVAAIGDQTIDEDGAAGPISFTVDDQETAANALTVTGASSNPTLVPNGNIVFSGNGANRTVTVTPVADASGSAQITVTVSDGELTGSSQFNLTVNAVNDTPTIAAIGDQTVDEDGTAGPVSFTVGDLETSLNALTLAGTSDNPSLVPDANIVFGGNGANRAVTLTPVADGFGTAQITVTVSDGELGSSSQFTLTVNAVNDQPTLTSINDQTIDEDTSAGPISFSVDDAESPADTLTVSAASSDPTLVPNGNLVLAGSGTSRTLTVTPAADQFGTTLITVTVSDGTLDRSESFTITVTELNDAPTITAIGDQTIDEDTATGSLSFTVGDAESSADMLTLSGTSSNPTLVPDGNIAFGGSGADRTVTVSPAADQFGAALITVTVSDGNESSSQTFTVTVNSVEDPPTPPSNLRIASTP